MVGRLINTTKTCVWQRNLPAFASVEVSSYHRRHEMCTSTPTGVNSLRSYSQPHRAVHRWSSVTSESKSSSSNEHYDVAIAGGGAVGSALARLLLDDGFGLRGKITRRRPLKVALLEQRSAPSSLDELVSKSQAPNARAYALSPTSLSYLGPSVMQNLVNSQRCGVYDAMQIWEHDGPAQLHFVGEDLNGAIEDGRLVDLHQYLSNTMKDTNDNSNKSKPWLGAVIEDAPLVSAIWDELKADDRIDLLDNIQIKSIDAPSQNSMGKIEPPPPVQITCIRSDKETTLSADLLVAADGAKSFVRKSMGNFSLMTRSYGRKAVTCTVELGNSRGDATMGRTAFQRFLPYGPIALLPVWNSNDDAEEQEGKPVYANVVWSTIPSEANYLLSLSPSDFISVLNDHLCQGPNNNPSLLSDSSQSNGGIPFITAIAKEVDSLLRTANTALTMGTWTESASRNYFRMPPRSVNVAGPILGFDLSLSHVVSSAGNGAQNGGYTSPRVALVGDAAHTMHPMAGQGLNLGMGDIKTLALLVKEAVDSGMDVGGTSLFLDRYNQERTLKGWSMVGGVHGLHEVFGCSGSMPGSVIDSSQDNRQGGSVGGIQSLIGYSRSLGMNVVNGIGPVRRALAEVAAGALPRGFN